MRCLIESFATRSPLLTTNNRVLELTQEHKKARLIGVANWLEVASSLMKPYDWLTVEKTSDPYPRYLFLKHSYPV